MGIISRRALSAHPRRVSHIFLIGAGYDSVVGEAYGSAHAEMAIGGISTQGGLESCLYQSHLASIELIEALDLDGRSDIKSMHKGMNNYYFLSISNRRRRSPPLGSLAMER